MLAVRRRWTGPCIVLAVAVLCGFLSGCGGNPYGVVPIRGKVTYDDGTLIPAPSIVVEFVSQEKNLDPKTYPRPGKAQVDVADGTFSSVSTYDYGDGAIVGQHKVVVKTYDQSGAPVYTYFPKEYSDATTTLLTEAVGDKRDFEIKVPKPGKGPRP